MNISVDTIVNFPNQIHLLAQAMRSLESRKRYTLLLSQLIEAHKVQLLEAAKKISCIKDKRLLIYTIWDQISEQNKLSIVKKWRWKSIPYHLSVPLFSKKHSSNIVQIAMLERCIVGKMPRLFYHICRKEKKRFSIKENCLLSVAIELEKHGVVEELIKDKRHVHQHLVEGWTPFEVAKLYRTSLGEALYNKIKQQDDGFSKSVSRFHLFGNALDLRGMAYETMGSTHRPLVMKYIKKALQNLIQRHADPSTKGFWKEVLDVCQNWVFNPLTVRSMRSTWSLIACGWEEHAITCLVSFDQKFVIVVDGAGSLFDGARIYKMSDKMLLGNVRQMALDLIDMEKRNVEEAIGERYITAEIQKNLKLHLVTQFPFEQEADNCLWFSMEYGVRTLIMMLEVERQRLNLVANYDKILQASEGLQNEFSSEVRAIVVEIGLQVMKTYPMICDREDAIFQLRSIKPLSSTDKTIRRIEGLIKVFQL